MKKENSKKSKDYGFGNMDYSLIDAVEIGSIEMVIQALTHNSECINERDNLGMNALQVAITEFHEDIALYLLENTKISVSHKDRLGRSSVYLGAHFGSSTLLKELNESLTDEICALHFSLRNFTPL